MNTSDLKNSNFGSGSVDDPVCGQMSEIHRQVMDLIFEGRELE
jgi:hypothetical protein